MTSVAALVSGQVQEVKARSLQTLMAILDEMGASSLPDASGGKAKHPRLGAQQATVLLPPQGARLTLALAGGPLEVILPEPMMQAFRANPAIFARGAQFPVEIDPQTGTLRLVLPHGPALPTPLQPTPATTHHILARNPGPSTAPAPPLPDLFPAGTPGALVQRLAQIALPLGERVSGSVAPGNSNLPGQSSPVQTSLLARSGATLPQLPQPLMDAALRAAMRQMPIATLLTSLLSHASSLPRPELAEAFRALRVDGLIKPDPTTIRNGVARSGLFLENTLAQAAQQGEDASRPASVARGVAGPDLKAMLGALRASLTAEEAPSTERVSQRPADNPALPTRQPMADRANPQQPVMDLPRMVEGAIERIKLQQLASLPDNPGLVVTDDRAQASRIALQIPLAPHGLDRPETAMIGLVIEREQRPDLPDGITVEDEGGQGSESFPWKVRIAVDLEETGPVQAEIALRGQRVAVTLWAERRAMAESARATIGSLHKALVEASFDVTTLDVRDGRPSGPSPRHMPMLDRRS